ncbi:extracellular solute-binding protein [Kaistia defluvii]|uniref:Multiple sugar transport system substrate-binding protein n=1 Tax=Kaistia defluvii TaxID=410841 RepID=A0ABV2R496_9HYPH
MIANITRRSLMAGSAALAAAAALAPMRALAATNINYWHHFTSQAEFAGLKAVMEAFAKANPEIVVTQENIPNPEFMAKFTAAVVSGSRPDTTMVTAERLADMLAMEGLVDITARVDGWPEKANFPADRWAGISKEGKIYGVPAFAFVDWGYYRSDWFEEAGIAGPPTTYAEFVDIAKKLTDPTKGRFGFGMRGGAGGQKYVLDMMESFGAPVVDAEGNIGLDRDKAIEAVKFYAGLFTTEKVVPPSAPGDGYRQIMEAFRTGQTAMVWHHTGSFQEISAALKPGVEFKTFAIPAGPAARVARLAYLYNGLMKEENADASWDWISYWGQAEPAIAFLEKTGYFPANAAVVKDERITGNPLYAPAVETLAFGRLPANFVGIAGWSEHTVLAAFQKVLIGQMTAEDAVDEMIAGLEETK